MHTFWIIAHAVLTLSKAFATTKPHDSVFERSTAVDTCDPSSSFTPLYRAYSSSAVDHFYTTSHNSLNAAVATGGYISEGITANLLIIASNLTISEPLFRLHLEGPNGITDHFYTTSAPEAQNAVDNLEYVFDWIQAWVYPTQVCGSVPLFRTYDGAGTDHFYTVNVTEYQDVVKAGFSDEGIVGYVLPA